MSTQKDLPQKTIWLTIFILLLGFSSLSDAYYSNLDTAELLKPGEYNVALEPQYVFDNYPGANVIAHFDMGGADNNNLKFLVGSGRTIFQAGAFYKLVFFPDFGDQPGIGIFGGLLYANRDGNSLLNIRLHPEISKKFKSVDVGTITPYGAVPFGVAFEPGNTQYPFQLALGSRWMPPSLKNTNFWAEFGFELNQAAFSYLSLGISVAFSDTNPFSLD